MNLREIVLKAQEAARAGRFGDAERLGEEALARDSGDVEALLVVGVARVRAGRFEEALEPLTRLLEVDSGSFFAPYWLSIAYRKLSHPDLARGYAERAVDNHPREPSALEQLGQCDLELGHFGAAEDCFRAAIEISGNRAALYGGLGLALQGQGRPYEAAGAFKRAARIEPQSYVAQLHLANALTDQGDVEGALGAARKAVELNPVTEAHLTLTRALLIDSQPLEAEEELKIVLETEPPSATLHVFSGRIMEGLGRMDEARAEYERALGFDPSHPDACLGISVGKKFTEEDQDFIGRMEARVQVPGLPLNESMSLRYALGKARQDLQAYEAAMGHFDEANRVARLIKYGDAPFDREAYGAKNDVSVRLFSREFLDRYRGEGISDATPIFVAGMMRSGTTLTEQILSRHPEVGASGEHSFWLRNRWRAFDSERRGLTAGKLGELAGEYGQTLRRMAPGGRFVVDKTPNHYVCLPLLHLAFPNARIVHIRRHPVDTCISIYTTPNHARTSWAHDRENIVFEYREYLRLMAAWRELIPSGRLLEISYEDLVGDQERVTRELIEFCGLDWNDACLRPEESVRGVLTPSAWQVRKPVYGTSVERWRVYEPWLGAFAQLLES